MQVTRVILSEVKLPLPQTLRLGPIAIRTRDFVAVRMETDAGICGDALGYSRGTPLMEALSTAGRGLVGSNPLMRRQTMHAFEQASITSRPTYLRAMSLLDTALWDICAQAAKLPLYQLLGGLRSTVPVTAVAGYYMDTRSVDDIAREVQQRVDQGYTRVKVMLKGDDMAFDENYVRAVTQAAPGQVAADAHWSWRSLTEALRFCQRIDDCGLAFLEDPFAPHDSALTAALQTQLRTPLAAGEDMVSPATMNQLAHDVAVLRVDATTCGGITGALGALHAASAGGCTVFPHVFAPLHVHLACAFSQVEAVEFIPPESGADPIDKLLLRPIRITDGHMTVDDEPGAGMTLNWPQVQTLASRTTVLDTTR
jgi:L-alanine-DL-glutamate epimerase-like enolase superfamily enzyme